MIPKKKKIAQFFKMTENIAETAQNLTFFEWLFH